MQVFRLGLVWLVLVASAAAQGPAGGGAGHEWTRVQAIPVGTLLHMKAPHGGLCRVASVEAEVLRCEASGSNPARSYERTEVQRVALSRRGVSAGAMAGIGAGIGVLATTITSKAGGLGGGAKGSVWAGAAGLGAVVFAPIGFFGDPFRGPVVYTAR